MLEKGYRLISEPQAYAWEFAPSTEHEAFVHQRRMSTGAIQTLFKFRKVLFNPKYGSFGLVILPGHRLSQILNPLFLFLVILFSTVTYFLAATPIMSIIIIIEILWLIIAFISFKLKIKIIPFDYLNYFSIIQSSTILSWLDFFKGNYKLKWEKVESNRTNGIPNVNQ